MEKELLKSLSNLLDEKLAHIENRLDKKLDEKLAPIKSKLDETYQIVKALEHSAEVNKAEQDKMSNDIAHIKGNVESIKKDLLQVEMVTSNNWNEITKLKSVK